MNAIKLLSQEALEAELSATAAIVDQIIREIRGRL